MHIAKNYGPLLFFIMGFLALGVSQTSSFLVETHLAQGRSVKVFDYLYMTHVRNHGGIFGLFQGKGWLVALVSVVFLAGLVLFVVFGSRVRKFEYLCFGLIVGGGISNVLDRVFYGSVIDFIDIRGIPHWHYIFNAADVCIHLGVWPLLLLSFFMRDPQPTHFEGQELGDSSP